MRFPGPLSLPVVVAISAGTGWVLTHSGSPSAPARDGRAARTELRPGWSDLAVARGHRLAVYARPESGRIVARLRNPTATHMPLTLLVRRTRPGWVQTFLPLRPNGSLGWVKVGSVRLITSPWSLTAHLREHRLVVSRGSRVVRVDRIAVGKPSTPTPVGTYFITELLQQPDPQGAYGPYAYGTSAYSTVIRHFGATGDGQIGLHGTDQPWVLGTSKTHGCIRVSNADVTWLSRRLPLGTPLRIDRS